MVIGAGPAGLTAAIYLARFRLRVGIADSGGGRAAIIPCTRNLSGYPGGISGRDLLERMARQAAEYDVRPVEARVTRLETTGTDFAAQVGDERWTARTVLLATGVTNHRPRMTAADHDRAVSRGLIRYCPVCDGYEVIDRRVGVIGTGTHAMKEALFLRDFTPDLTLVAPDGAHCLTPDERAQLSDAGVKLIDGPHLPIEIDGDTVVIPTDSQLLAFDSIYPALGSNIHAGLAVDLGACCAEDGALVTDAHQRTSVRGLYAAGDVVSGLDQISNAMGQAGVAATAIRNDLAAAARGVGGGWPAANLPEADEARLRAVRS